MKKFKVGDRVECIDDDSGVITTGEKGVVVGVEFETIARVRWDKNGKDRHNCGGLCETGHGFNLKFSELNLISKNNNLKSTIGRALKNRGFSKAYRNEVMPYLEDAYFQQNDKLCFLRTRKGVGYALRNPEDKHDAELAICLCVERVFGGEVFECESYRVPQSGAIMASTACLHNQLDQANDKIAEHGAL